VLLGASNESGNRQWYVDNPDGLTTEECLNFLLCLPQINVMSFTYGFNYDLTMMLRDLDDESLYRLFRPELRQRSGRNAVKGPKPISWHGYKLNLQGTKFTIARGDRYRVIWDCVKFFQAKFVNALRDWKVGDKETLDKMERMKDKRADFDKESPEAVRKYCLEECQYMAQLARKLIEAHTAVGLKLKSFYGAGSSGSAMLEAMGIKDKIALTPKDMMRPVAAAFFGGRFENSVIGTIKQRVYNYDISSAYPYQLYFLPCLIHAKWKKTKSRKDIENARTALVKYGLGTSSDISWGPFPFRETDGSICYPVESGGGWVWKDEFEAGERLFNNVQFKEAWVYYSKCSCHPFERIASYYAERCRIGKEGPGIVLKLGCNSCYGKLAQSIGLGKFNSWIWAGMITSGCRAQMLDLMALHKDMSNLLMIATDGVYTREKLKSPSPKNTGTNATGKPLGGWEEKIVDKGVFVARPGIYFPLDPTDKELKDVRGRGVGKGVVLENWKVIVDSWDEHKLERTARIANVTRFCGAKSSISRQGKEGDYWYTRADGREGPAYGQWITRPVDMGFHPMPKRSGINPDGQTLSLRRIDSRIQSTPYIKAIRNQEARMLQLAQLELTEQPDADYSDYENE
jgi:hypothetical protein